MTTQLYPKDKSSGILQEGSVSEQVETYKSKYEKAWWDTSLLFHEPGPSYDRALKKSKERHADQLVESFSQKLENFPQEKEQRLNWNRETMGVLREAGGEFFGITDPRLSEVIFGGFMEVTHGFIREAKNFDPGISLVDIMQAMRNVWIMNCIQVLLEEEVKFTSSIFGYSMLYPVTDNYMDDPKVSSRRKMEISRNFQRRLSGEALIPRDKYEESIFSLIGKIEAQYPRGFHPRVYESLLGIHKAQEQSIGQQKKGMSPYESDILGISFEKGGTSVLADAFLVKSGLREKDADYIFGFGVLLQLIDDLQDAAKDLKNGHMTIFSLTAQQWKLDGITARLFNFLQNHMKAWREDAGAKAHEMLLLIENNCILLIMEAIARNQKLFGREFIKQIEPYSPYRFGYLVKLGERLQKKYSRLEAKCREIPIEDILSQAMEPVQGQASCK